MFQFKVTWNGVTNKEAIIHSQLKMCQCDLLGKLTDQLPQEPLFINKNSAYEISHSIKVQPRDLHDS